MTFVILVLLYVAGLFTTWGVSMSLLAEDEPSQRDPVVELVVSLVWSLFWPIWAPPAGMVMIVSACRSGAEAVGERKRSNAQA